MSFDIEKVEIQQKNKTKSRGHSRHRNIINARNFSNLNRADHCKAFKVFFLFFNKINLILKFNRQQLTDSFQFRMYHAEKFIELLKRSSKVEFERVLDKEE